MPSRWVRPLELATCRAQQSHVPVVVPCALDVPVLWCPARCFVPGCPARCQSSSLQAHRLSTANTDTFLAAARASDQRPWLSRLKLTQPGRQPNSYVCRLPAGKAAHAEGRQRTHHRHARPHSVPQAETWPHEAHTARERQHRATAQTHSGPVTRSLQVSLHPGTPQKRWVISQITPPVGQAHVCQLMCL